METHESTNVDIAAHCGCRLNYVEHHGMLDINYEGPQRTLTELRSLVRPETVRNLNIVKCPAEDDDLSILSEFTGLTKIRVVDMGITGRGLGWLRHAAHLQIAYFENCPNLADEIIETLSYCRKLEKLYVVNCPLTDESTIWLRPLTQLTVLQLSRTKMTDACIDNLTGLTNLRSLWLPGGVTEAAENYIRSVLPTARPPLIM